MSNFVQITPFLDAQDLPATLAFFQDILGFDIIVNAPNYAYIERENVAIRLMQNDLAAPPATHQQQRAANPTAALRDYRRFAAYIDVRNVDDLYAELKPKLDTLPKDHVYGPVNQSYGQREFMVLTPGNFIIAFGQPLAKP